MERLPLEPALWAKTAPPAPPVPPLEDDVSADVAIVGAGYCGLSAALHLAEAGRSVVVVEAEEPGFGGSGRNNGHCVPDWIWHDPDEIDARFGAERGARVNDMQGDAAELVFSLIGDHRIECEAVQSGSLNVVRHAKYLRELRGKYQQWRRHGKAVRWLEGAEIGGYVGSDAFVAAILYETGGHLNPLAFSRGLAAAAQKAGARVHGRSPATGLERAGERWRVSTPGGRVDAGAVVLATNAHRHGLWPGLDDSYYVVRALGAATEPLAAEVRRAVLPHDHNIQELGHPRYFFFFFDGAGRLVTGGGVGRGVNETAQQVTDWAGAELARLFPRLGEVRFEHYWQGYIDMAPSKFVGVHRLAEDLYASVGFSGRGVPTATAVGREIARMLIAGDADAMALPLTPLPRAPFARLGSRLIGSVWIPIARVAARLSR